MGVRSGASSTVKWEFKAQQKALKAKAKSRVPLQLCTLTITLTLFIAITYPF